MGDIHREHRPCEPYAVDDETLKLNLRFVRESSYLAAVVGEYAMFPALAHSGLTPWFWKAVPGGIQFHLSKEGTEWHNEYMPDRV